MSSTEAAAAPDVSVVDVLTDAVRRSTGIPPAVPRPGQGPLSEQIWAALTNTGGQATATAKTGLGKALDVDTPIPTPAGWTRMGDLVVGDLVYSEHGEPIRVAAAYDVQHDRPCYEVSFSDGTSIVADGEHLWASVTAAARAAAAVDGSAPAWQVLTTEQIAATLVAPDGTRLNHAMPASRTPQWHRSAARHPGTDGVVLVTAVTPVASRPVRCIGVDSPTRLFLAGEGMTPTHNSFAYGVPAGLLAATTGRRSVISTESLALQAQVIDKDAPVIVEAVKAATGVEVTFEVLKGWSNWACMRSTLGTAHHLLGEQIDTGDWVPTDDDIDALCDRLAGGLGDPTVVRLDGGATAPRGELVALTHWALRQHKTFADAPGDRHSYPGNASDAAWSQVSVTPSECTGVKTCPLAAMCKPAAAKERASRADVLVTNHSLLAVQAAKRVSVVVGSQALGRFDAVIVDEAHGLPGKVRDQGAGEVSSRRILSAVRAASQAFAEAARAQTASPDVAPVLHALMLGLAGQRYQRFVEAARRAEQGTASSTDALFALFFLVDAALER